jgi:hypothetical protein
MHTVRAAAAALLLLAGLAPAALAGTSDVPDSFTVNGTLTVTGIPASISYGNVDAGATSAIQSIDANVASNTNWGMFLTGSGFSGPAALPSSVRRAQISVAAPGSIQSGTASFFGFDAAILTDSNPEVFGPPTAGLGVHTDLRVVIPPAAATGAYSGTVTFTFQAI